MLARLIAAAQRGVEVRLLVDPVGSFGVRRSHFDGLTKAGGKFAWFRTAHPLRNRWTFTLRNHRKLQIIDCRTCFIGGMNMGREYAGEDPKVGPWRDLQIEITGGATRKFQMVFADDWFFATQEKLLAPRILSAAGMRADVARATDDRWAGWCGRSDPNVDRIDAEQRATARLANGRIFWP